MSLKYKLFGIPTTTDEVLEKASSKGIDKVILEIDYGSYPDPFFSEDTVLYTKIYLSLSEKRKKTKVYHSESSIMGPVPMEIETRRIANFQQKCFNERDTIKIKAESKGLKFDDKTSYQGDSLCFRVKK